MTEKRETIEELAQNEVNAEKAQAHDRELLLANSGKLATEVPKSFFEMCGMLREGVRRFNSAADPQRRLTWRESAALAARDANLNGDFNLEFGRNNVTFSFALNVMGRSGRPDVYIMEGTGQLGAERCLLRIEGFINKTGDVGYRVLLDFRRLEVTLEEMAERIVIAVIKGDYAALLQR
jgi:hypothetical protein